MPPTFMLLRLLRWEIDGLEKLGRLEMKLRTATWDDKPEIERKINAVMDEITQSSRAIQELKASHLMATQVLGS